MFNVCRRLYYHLTRGEEPQPLNFVPNYFSSHRLDKQGTNLRALLRTKPAHQLPRTVELGAGRPMGALLRINHPEAFKRYSGVDMWSPRGECPRKHWNKTAYVVSCILRVHCIFILKVNKCINDRLSSDMDSRPLHVCCFLLCRLRLDYVCTIHYIHNECLHWTKLWVCINS